MLIPLLDAVFTSWHGWPASLLEYFTSLTYAICVGALLSPFAPEVWKRTAGLTASLRWLARCSLVAVATAGGCLLAGLPMRAIFGAKYNYWASFKASYGIAIVFSACASGFLSMYERFRWELQITQLQLKEKEVEREKALKLATEATLSSLESRMHPHFLFNTINSISALIQEDPARAEKMLSQMADLLRFSLEAGRCGLVPLASELKIVRDYLEIEKARFADRLRYDIQVPVELDELPFPPLSLQTLVENSVKYAVNSTRQGADIVIRARRRESRVILSVEDNGPGFDAATLPAGHGLSSLAARLHSLYADAAQLEIFSQAGCTVVGLHVPFRLEASKT